MFLISLLTSLLMQVRRRQRQRRPRQAPQPQSSLPWPSVSEPVLPEEEVAPAQPALLQEVLPEPEPELLAQEEGVLAPQILRRRRTSHLQTRADSQFRN